MGQSSGSKLDNISKNYYATDNRSNFEDFITFSTLTVHMTLVTVLYQVKKEIKNNCNSTSQRDMRHIPVIPLFIPPNRKTHLIATMGTRSNMVSGRDPPQPNHQVDEHIHTGVQTARAYLLLPEPFQSCQPTFASV